MPRWASKTDIRRDLHARLQTLPMSFHHRWQSGQLVSRIMSDLSTIRDLMSFGAVFMLLNVLQITAVTVCLLVMYWPLGLVVLGSIVPIMATVLHYQGEFTRLSRQAQDQSGHIATHVEESALGRGVVLAFGREDHVFERFDARATRTVRDRSRQGVGGGEVLDLARGHPQSGPHGVAGFRCVRGGPRSGHGRHAGRLHHHDAVAGLAGRVDGLSPVDDPGGDDGGEPDRRNLRAPCEITDGPHPDPVGAGRLELRDVGFRVPDPAGATDGCFRHVTLAVEPGETVALVGATGAGQIPSHSVVFPNL